MTNKKTPLFTVVIPALLLMVCSAATQTAVQSMAFEYPDGDTPLTGDLYWERDR